MLMIPKEEKTAQMKGEFVVVVKGSPSNNPSDKRAQVFERHSIKITDCSSGEFDISALSGLQITKKINSIGSSD